MRHLFLWPLFFILLLTTSCASNGLAFDPLVSTQSFPTITRVSPTTVARGATLTLFGRGFASAAALNIAVIGNAQALGETYTLLATPTADELESLTITVPATAETGDQTVFLTVIENVSNTDTAVTITP